MTHRHGEQEVTSGRCVVSRPLVGPRCRIRSRISHVVLHFTASHRRRVVHPLCHTTTVRLTVNGHTPFDRRRIIRPVYRPAPMYVGVYIHMYVYIQGLLDSESLSILIREFFRFQFGIDFLLKIVFKPASPSTRSSVT